MAQLEADLIGEEIDTEEQKNVDTGRRANNSTNQENPFKRNVEQHTRKLAIKQGTRQRHPDHVLHQFTGINNTTSKASTQWEDALMYENKRVEFPDEFMPHGDTEEMANQLGVAPIAMQNYKLSQPLLDQMHVVGV